MDINEQQYRKFYLTGRRDGTRLGAFGPGYRPALLARYADLTALRYDFPLVLAAGASAERTVRSLTSLVDEAVASLEEGTDRDRLARHGHRLEAHLRRMLDEKGPGDFATLWHTAADSVAGDDDSVRSSAMKLWRLFGTEGDLVDADGDLPGRVVRAVWKSANDERQAAFESRAARLLFKLRAILEAEIEHSSAGRSPERLRASVGAGFSGAFDFDAFARVLNDSRPGASLSDSRRERIRGLIGTISEQRFFRKDGGYDFAFTDCAGAIAAYNERYPEAVELLRALAVAELESEGEYREPVHDALFEGFGGNGLEPAELALLPDYLICDLDERIDAAEMQEIVEALAAGLPFKVLVQSDDILRRSAVAEGHVALGLRSRQLVNTAMGLNDVFVLQAPAARLFAVRDALADGFRFAGPALFSVFSGASPHVTGVGAYLFSAAAEESRVFPTVRYDPAKGDDWATRLSLEGNPDPESDWPVHRFLYEDRNLQAVTEEMSFTPADFLSLDARFAGHFAVLPSGSDPADFGTVRGALGESEELPAIPAVADDRLERVLPDKRILDETRRALAMWHWLQELGGIHNSHAERLLAEERRRAAAAVPEPPLPPVGAGPAPEPKPDTEPETAPASDEPYIETSRCTSCNECTHVNPRMFVYNENRQAYIADADAGTYRQLVEAAEGCQVGIIHPGKPRNPNEPGLEDLLQRAEAFQ